MKSNYLKCDDIDKDEIVLCDEKYRKNNEDSTYVRVISVNQLFALVENSKGYQWSISRNRLTKIK